MKAKQFMDKNFVYISKDDSVVEVSKTMEEVRRFTFPVVDENKILVGWVTAFEITKGLREGAEKISEIMSPPTDVDTVHENDPARIAVIKTSDNRFVTVPVLNDDKQVMGMVRSCDIVSLLSELYDIKLKSIYLAMQKQLRGVNWDELMEASANVSTRTTGNKITAKEYEDNINNATFGEAIWATGGLENFFAGLIAVGELVLARKVGRARK